MLRPFFSYYGGKWRDALKYPEPRHGTIVEPFAGSAGYATRWHERDVVLCEKDPLIAGVWSYLIGVSSAEILSIPDIGPGQTVDDLPICLEARALVGLWLNRGATGPRKSPSKWMREGLRPGSFWGQRVRETIASQVDSIRHWTIRCGSYEQIGNREATWFVDPPYERAGRHYVFGSEQISYSHLADWCAARNGQVIVCEQTGASWAPFGHLADTKTTRRGKRSSEAVWFPTEAP